MGNKRLHIGFICNEYPGIGPNGGIGSFTKELGKQLSVMGHLVTVFGVYKRLNKRITLLENGVKAIGIPYTYIPRIHWELNRWRLMQLIRSEHRKSRLSILEAPDYQGWLRRTNINIPKIIRIHSPQKIGLDPSVDLEHLSQALVSEERSLLHADFLWACGKSVAEAAKKTYINTLSVKSPIKIIYNSINTTYFRPKEDKGTTAINIVFAGRLTVKKGVIELIKAWPKIASKFSGARLILAGRDSVYGESNSMITELKKILPVNIHNTVIFKGFLTESEILRLFQDATICVFPSHREAFSVVVLEAMATSTPVIYSKIGPGYEIIKDGENGILCDPHNPDDISDKVICLLKDKDLIKTIGLNARKHVVDNFSLQHLAKKNLEYYRSSISKYLHKEHYE
jgi:glycosyltransferase involved in cell wall biosynthesis